jgi:NitT/TauT family transport system substrate-binding protein
MKRILMFAAIVTLGFSSMADARTYKIGTFPWIGFSPNDVAEVKGFWETQGTDVELIKFASDIDCYNALVNKRIDMAYLLLGSWIRFYMEGAPLTIIAEVDWSHGSDKIIVKQGFDIGQFKGRNVGIYYNDPSVLFFLHQYLAKNGIKLSEVRPIELEPEKLADSFIFDRLKSIVLYDPVALRAEREGNGKIVTTTASYPGCMPNGIAMRTDVLKEIPKEDLAKIFKGWVEAVKWIENEANWEEYKGILNNKTFEGASYSDEDLRGMYEGVRIHDVEMLWERNKDEGGLSTWLKEIRTMLKENDRLTKDFKPEEIFDNTAITDVLQSMQ